MAESQKHLKIWYDPEGDYLEVIFEQKEGISAKPRMTKSWKRSTMRGNVLGFSVLRISAMKERPLDVAL